MTCMYLLAGCASTEPAGQSLGPVISLDFLADGCTTIEQCVQRLGSAGQTIPGTAGGKMLTYWLAEDAGSLHLSGALPWFKLARYSLVLSFDVDGVLVRHAIVKVWGH
jgi:hypothetical protein